MLTLLLLFPDLAHAVPCQDKIAQAVSIQGEVEVLSNDSRWNRVSLNNVLCPGDMLRVGENSRASLVLNDATLMRLDQNTVVTFPNIDQGSSSWVKLLNGVAHFIARVRQSFEVVTPFMNAGIEGTEFIVAVTADTAQVTVLEGQVAARNQYGSLVLRPGQSAEARAGQAPVLKTLVRPRDAVQWALHYPTIAEIDPRQFDQLPAAWQAPLAESFKAYRQGDVARALQAITAMPAIADAKPGAPSANPNEPDPFPVYLYRAALRLGVGRVAEAQADLAYVLEHDPDNSQALALQAIIAVVQNAKAEGLALAQQAVRADPLNPAAALALSYARQASFDISGALAAVEQALVNHKQDALIWARLAELRLAQGQLEKSLTAAREAVKLNPDLARAQSVLGFAYLTQIDIDQAQAAFRQAITLDQTDPLPRLGLGLATIRQGDLEQGRREIEIAASLDPNSSLIRSYLGKAYYDERRDEVAATELANAKQLDPFDPTPWFYDAIRKQTDNRPVEALTDLQKSIELNDNRAVYRSRLLLDNDLAARSASLARIYDETGFEQLSLSEAYKSVNTNPGDYSAHRFLSDSYAALPRHEIARVSELLQSQLLQPLNLNPLQPQLAESNLAILEGSGPSSLSFNEFNPLFTRNRTALLANAVLGSNASHGDNVVVSGLHNRFSYSLGQFHYETDGFRENNDLNIDIYNAFAQLSLSPDTDIQGEIRYNDIVNGDLPLRFFADDFSDTLEQERQTKSLRLGFHHRLSPGSNVIGSLIGNRSDFSTAQTFLIPDIDGEIVPITAGEEAEQKSYSAEVQHLFRRPNASLISGAGYTLFDNRSVFIFGTPSPSTDSNTDHGNGYAYSGINLFRGLDLTLGISVDDLKTDIAGLELNRSQLNPKFGLVWKPTSSTVFRAAAFRVLKRTLVTNQTIEPTQVAGFNQFFDDENATDSRRYGIALDQVFSPRLYAGIEFSKRDLDVPFRAQSIDEATGEIIEDKITNTTWEEQLGRAYLYWTPNSRLALSIEQSYEKFDRGEDFFAADQFSRITTWRTPLTLNYYGKSGYSAGLTATYVDQHGIFASPRTESIRSGHENFWVLDAELNYRLPKRTGILALGINNLLNESFRFQDTDSASPEIFPERAVFAKIALAF